MGSRREAVTVSREHPVTGEEPHRMEVAAALLDASRKLSDKEKREASTSTSTGNISMGSCSSWASHTEVRVYCLLSVVRYYT